MPEILPVQSHKALRWFADPAGQAVLASEHAAIVQTLQEHGALPWVWWMPQRPPAQTLHGARGLVLWPDATLPDAWQGSVRCTAALPLAMDSCGLLVMQHALDPRADLGDWLAECDRVLMPGGWLLLCALNPLSPYRRHWQAAGLRAAEPMRWRRALRRAGFTPDVVSEGRGPRWSRQPDPDPQQGPGLRAAYLIRAQKRRRALTPLRQTHWQLATDPSA